MPRRFKSKLCAGEAALWPPRSAPGSDAVTNPWPRKQGCERLAAQKAGGGELICGIRWGEQQAAPDSRCGAGGSQRAGGTWALRGRIRWFRGSVAPRPARPELGAPVAAPRTKRRRSPPWGRGWRRIPGRRSRPPAPSRAPGFGCFPWERVGDIWVS